MILLLYEAYLLENIIVFEENLPYASHQIREVTTSLKNDLEQECLTNPPCSGGQLSLVIH